MAEELFRNYTRQVFSATKVKGWDGKIDIVNDTDTELQWSFAGSLLFSITVITTIGGLLVYRIHTYHLLHTFIAIDIRASSFTFFYIT